VEKLLYPVWKDPSLAADEFRDALLLQLGPQLANLAAVHGLRMTVADSAVAAAAARRIESHTPVPDAVLSLWVDFAGAAALWEPLIDAHVSRRTGYLVAEAEPLVNQQAHSCAPGERMHGMCQVVFMSRPAQQDRNEWLNVWKDSHTQVAIDTQATFGYRQNLVVSNLTDETLVCDAVVEENFPPEAMVSDHAFYGSGGDDVVLQQRMTAMIESCARFIDFEKIDVIPMSEYLVKPLV
jgi:hypothetical protein